jgi:outer membrane lipoprotein-sorting protein
MFFTPWLSLNSQSSDQRSGKSHQIIKVRNALNSIKPFKVNFTQQVYSDDQMDLEESGAIIFKDDRSLRWTYREPDYKVFLLEGDNYKFYDEDNEQLLIGKVSDQSGQWLWQLFFSDSILPFTNWNEKDRIIKIKDSNRELEMEITLDNEFLPVKVNQIDASGVSIVYLFNDYLKNISVSAENFNLKVPDDVEIIRE